MAETDRSTGKRNFFISKKQPKANKNPSQSSTSSGNFFITASVKNKLSGVGPTQRHSAQGQNPIKKSTKSKKPFDKKQWRMKRYSKKYKLEEWENKRKKHVLEEYYKEIKDELPTFDVKKIYEKYGDEEGENDNNFNQDLSLQISSSSNVDSRPESTVISSRGKKTKAYKKAKSEFQRIQEEKQRKREEISAKKSEREEALKQYKAKKLEKYKKLNKKTKKGQPIMKHRMEMLLEQIQNSMS